MKKAEKKDPILERLSQIEKAIRELKIEMDELRGLVNSNPYMLSNNKFKYPKMPDITPTCPVCNSSGLGFCMRQDCPH